MTAISYLSQWIVRLTGLGSLAMGTMTGYYALRIIACQDESLVGQYKARLKNVFSAAIVLISISGVLFFVATKFFGVSAGSIAFLK